MATMLVHTTKKKKPTCVIVNYGFSGFSKFFHSPLIFVLYLPQLSISYTNVYRCGIKLLKVLLCGFNYSIPLFSLYATITGFWNIAINSILFLQNKM